MAECWGAGTATIMILGDLCTRGCRFCNVKTGNPRGEVDWLEPLRVAEAVRDLGWKYLVVTAVDRDDLPDGGALIFANTVRAIHERVPGARVEILSGDYRGDLTAVNIVVDARPDVFAHNLETVRRLTPHVRDKRAGYDQSLKVLAHAKGRAPNRYTKTSLMLGLGETEAEIETAMDDARAPASTSSRWANTCSPPRSICRSSSSSRPKPSSGSARSPPARASIRSSPARSPAAPITPNRRSKPRRRNRG